MIPDERGISAREAAALIGLSRSFIIGSNCPRHRFQGNGPKGRPLLRFYPSEVRDWWRSREITRESIARDHGGGR